MAPRLQVFPFLSNVAFLVLGLLLQEGSGARLRRRVPSAAKSISGNSTGALSFTVEKPPSCGCQVSDPSWKKTSRTTPECIFIDLGAADGNTFSQFMQGGYGPVKNCPGGGAFEAYLVEANPHFDTPLKTAAGKNPKKVHPLPSTAAYMCEGQTTFYLDTVNHGNNYWGSSMSKNHPDAQKSGHEAVTVPTINLIRMLYENTIPGDWVMVKMDIEGAEYEILPCLASAPETAKLVDRLYLEQHPSTWAKSSVKAPDATIATAIQKLRSFKVDIPEYFSQTL